MARVAARRSRQTRRVAESGPVAVRTRSFACPDDLWSEVAAFAKERGLGAPSVAARVLLRSGLGVERRSAELRAARDWQIEQAWAELKAIDAGRQDTVGWSEIEDLVEQARRRVRRREGRAKGRRI